VGEVLVDADLGEGGPWRLGSWVEPSSLRITTTAHKIYGITPERERDATKKRLAAILSVSERTIAIGYPGSTRTPRRHATAVSSTYGWRAIRRKRLPRLLDATGGTSNLWRLGKPATATTLTHRIFWLTRNRRHTRSSSAVLMPVPARPNRFG
jgi:hypothetical protein